MWEVVKPGALFFDRDSKYATIDAEKGWRGRPLPPADTGGKQQHREKPHGAGPELSPGLGRAPDQMVMTLGVPVNLICNWQGSKIDQ
jgi:hypothetical protein